MLRMTHITAVLAVLLAIFVGSRVNAAPTITLGRGTYADTSPRLVPTA